MWDLLEGKDYLGRPLEGRVADRAREMITPLVIQEIEDAWRVEGWGRGALVAGPAFFGVGTSTYEYKTGQGPRKRTPKIKMLK